MSEISVKSEGIGIPKNQVETLKAIEPVMFDTHFIPFLIYEKNDIYHHYIIIYIYIYLCITMIIKLLDVTHPIHVPV